MNLKRIVILCGNGVASSATAASKLKDLLLERGITVDIETRAYRDMAGIGYKPDLIIPLAPGFGQGGFGIGYQDVPIIIGVSLLTGIGYEELLVQIEDTLRRE